MRSRTRTEFCSWATLATIVILQPGIAGEVSGEAWPPERITAALQSLVKLKTAGLISEGQYQRKHTMLEDRHAGLFKASVLSLSDPAEVDFIQNGGFEEINENSGRNRSRWLWWEGWSWSGDYENFWESRKEFVHSGNYSAGIRCTGMPGRIGINTPMLPLLPGVREYLFTVWAKGEGDNQLFLSFESGAAGALRKKIGSDWEHLALKGIAEADAKDFRFYIYVAGRGTIWLDDAKLVPVGEKKKE